MPPRTLVVRPPGEPERVGRTRRALASAGIAAEDAGADLAGVIAGAGRPVWLVRAGAWPAHPGPLSAPPRSASGKPLVAFGAVIPEGGPDPGAATSLYLEPEPAAEVARSLGRGCDFDAAARDLLAGGGGSL